MYDPAVVVVVIVCARCTNVGDCENAIKEHPKKETNIDGHKYQGSRVLRIQASAIAMMSGDRLLIVSKCRM
jgi:hypothetical protein